MFGQISNLVEWRARKTESKDKHSVQETKGEIFLHKHINNLYYPDVHLFTTYTITYTILHLSLYNNNIVRLCFAFHHWTRLRSKSAKKFDRLTAIQADSRREKMRTVLRQNLLGYKFTDPYGCQRRLAKLKLYHLLLNSYQRTVSTHSLL